MRDWLCEEAMERRRRCNTRVRAIVATPGRLPAARSGRARFSLPAQGPCRSGERRGTLIPWRRVRGARVDGRMGGGCTLHLVRWEQLVTYLAAVTPIATVLRILLHELRIRVEKEHEIELQASFYGRLRTLTDSGEEPTRSGISPALSRILDAQHAELSEILSVPNDERGLL